MYNQSGYPPPYPDAGSGQYPPGPGYPGAQGGYPPPSVGFQPGPGPYPPAPGGYPPPQGYPPEGGYPPPQGYPPAGGYPPPQGYPPAGGYPPPVSQQPMSGGQPPVADGGWMNLPTGPPANCPPGLEYLTSIDQLLVHQKVELLEALIGFESKNKFTVKNSLGQKVFYAAEQSDCCTRNCCGPWRPFGMKILDNFKNEVIHLERPLACDSCWFPCCLQKMEVYAPPGCLVGTVEQDWSILAPAFSIKNAAGDTVLRIEGPVCTMSICGSDVEFNVLSKDGSTKVGRISKQWTGLLREAFTDADYFGITFPMDLDVRMKAVMLGACFLIDAMFFEKSGNQERDRPGMF
ncbi:phospholipid scramblase 2 isoform X1 [Homalodisca vitripennis]|uniref:phospholipid scramblase 2 isoform X1 n=1 Tax=Homalodisca vitripennis TaxID=197043 RepID=UPI001EEC4A73|nr:phospholipid scramblase 2 isoform X1 [Homalodisca vitripennis]XP_046673251.1 phospholipid scramblase 2 isoform X1 [Homalodisca vitripennis]XP_046673252.1 phospholipid scramblase 2 isoform X1 [Homalodisca vitripennis]XP_046673253.1 phospholipid scramblase 2 isoform X1 [Homalodisca vitripennis]XP_046673254.1 phospholipid scramblase 2 isoform X1 [Homalodisca vitripennis]